LIAATIAQILRAESAPQIARSASCAARIPARVANTNPLTENRRRHDPCVAHTGGMDDTLTMTAVFTSDEDGWTMAQLAEWPAVITCAPSVEEA